MHRVSFGADRLGILICVAIGCAASPRIIPEAQSLPDQTITDERLDQDLADADLVVAGHVVDYYPWPPPIEPHEDSFAPVTYDVLRVFKGRELVAENRVVIYELTRWPSALVADDLSLKRSVFGEGRTLVVFARRDGSYLHSRGGAVAATSRVLEFLDRRAPLR